MNEWVSVHDIQNVCLDRIEKNSNFLHLPSSAMVMTVHVTFEIFIEIVESLKDVFRQNELDLIYLATFCALKTDK